MISINRPQAAWIGFPGDFELWLHREVSLRRDERLSVIPPFWRLDTHFTSLKYRKWVELAEPEEVSIVAEGQYNIGLDDRYVYGNPPSFTIPAGKHLLIVTVIAETVIPAMHAQGRTFCSDSSWEVTTNNHVWLPAETLDFHSLETPPSSYRLATVPMLPSAADNLENFRDRLSQLFDFGKETFGYIRLHNLKGEGRIFLYYGESKEEALSPDECETYDALTLAADKTITGAAFSSDEPGLAVVKASRAFRYVQVVSDGSVQFEAVSMLYEYLPVAYRGQFRCSDDRINAIWDTSIYTLHLTTREFFLDGIKRDRWVWSGDACQSFLMNYYSFFDQAVCRRTLLALRGKDPVETHINHILDYTFYWIISMDDYHRYTGDVRFIRAQYPKIRSLLQFCIGRANDDGFLAGLPDDWVFVDWGNMDNKGEVCFEQVLFCRSLEVAAQFAAMFEYAEEADAYLDRAVRLKRQIINVFWDEEAGGLVHSRQGDVLNRHMTKYANMFALSYGFFSEAQAASVIRNIMLNDRVQPITTPYMRFYELASLCEIGEHDYVMKEIGRYWGGMLDLGATSFWETFDPDASGADHYAMYNRKFGKSLCHSWGASPVYLLGKYYLGVKPTSPGYATYSVTPELGGLEWIEGKVPVPSGEIGIAVNLRRIKIDTAGGVGTLIFVSRSTPEIESGHAVKLDSGRYELELQPHSSYTIHYKA